MGLILYTVRNDFGMQYTAKVIGAKYLSKPASRIGLGETVKAAARRVTDQEYTGPKRLLIAEDTVSVQDLLKRQLQKLGAEADFVGTGIEALRALEEKKHGILFTDLHMPDMDGYQLAATIRAREEKEGVDMLKRFPIVVLTADVQMAQRQAYLAHGFDECMLKPVSLGQFRQLLIRWGVLRESEEAPVEEEAPAAPVQMNGPSAVDRDMIVRQMGALDKDTIAMLGVFIDMTRPQMEKIKEAFNAGDLPRLKELAHSLKGAARSACCMKLGDLASAMQDQAARGEAFSEDQMMALMAEFDRAEREIGGMKP